MVNESLIWVWCGENVSDHDVNNWQMVRKLLELVERSGDYIIEFMTHAELREFETNLQAKGWQVDNDAAQNTPHVTCWKRALAYNE
jgi:hypothetical protein